MELVLFCWTALVYYCRGAFCSWLERSVADFRLGSTLASWVRTLAEWCSFSAILPVGSLQLLHNRCRYMQYFMAYGVLCCGSSAVFMLHCRSRTFSLSLSLSLSFSLSLCAKVVISLIRARTHHTDPSTPPPPPHTHSVSDIYTHGNTHTDGEIQARWHAHSEGGRQTHTHARTQLHCFNYKCLWSCLKIIFSLSFIN